MKHPTIRIPKYGDEVFVPSEHLDGHWTNGIVNSGYKGTPHTDGCLLVAALGHAKSTFVSVPVDGYGEHWCWPEDVGAKKSGTKRSTLADVQG